MASNQHADDLRNAGLKVTSARVAALQSAPVVLEEFGYLTPKLLIDATRAAGYTLSSTTIYRLLPKLIDAGLLSRDAFDAKTQIIVPEDK
ncbi:hypothetical protein LMG31886_21950 [Xanthomonas hydrangeae]|uniref:hypothetical protein n=1 Tax=Xanthomonas hydrangeae TaxID=2775159 RepID=UPI001963A4D9|nr:hypothetical protein LMG31884_22490 [Xanthomonas hydrangeae]CAD7716609.1 hypothetical protein LMG31884_22490 [Xanthomonas hydrangeae]CAD7732166.1 hypothetical protein LMG31887_22480 [Xanthomonas hydrangeae]CAD7732169.1 hypothetical protein LMG31887_22480 [Xanthomonas hydrangeae]CAD7735101.1 hypothetical protein LMG31886_21950 [Xanthomonas hydrangeae]